MRITPRRISSHLRSSHLSLTSPKSLLSNHSTMTSPPPPTITMKPNPLPRTLYPINITYNPSDFKRIDENSDAQWYSQPRFVQHIDDGAISALKSYYGSIIKPHHGVLNLYSSWVSHLPSSFKPRMMVGIGMNALEFRRNEHLTSHFVKDLNVSPKLEEVELESMDVVICNVSVDYLVKPIRVFDEMRRVLKPGGTTHMVFSNRCFPTKVIGPWMGMSDVERRRWIGGYFWASGRWEEVVEVVIMEGKNGWFGGEDPLFVVRGRKTVIEE
ncbi:hypothetical protein B0J14DRAFT_605741 [Halenospora varia]|nr:hypothetical protein B0J14DRAFT_605741 [Halenospora varia]